MSSWFSSVPIAKIESPNKFYFLTSDRLEKGFFKIYTNESVQLISTDVKSIPSGNRVFAVHREVIDAINPAKDFTFKTTVRCGMESRTFGGGNLGEVLTENTYKSSEYLTLALLSSGEQCVDLGEHILILSCGMVIPKFHDEKVLEKLTQCMNNAVYNYDAYNAPHFEVKSDHVTVKVEIKLAKEFRERLEKKDSVVFQSPKEEEKDEEEDE